MSSQEVLEVAFIKFCSAVHCQQLCFAVWGFAVASILTPFSTPLNIIHRDYWRLTSYLLSPSHHKFNLYHHKQLCQNRTFDLDHRSYFLCFSLSSLMLRVVVCTGANTWCWETSLAATANPVCSISKYLNKTKHEHLYQTF